MSDYMLATATVVAAMIRKTNDFIDVPNMIREVGEQFKRLENPTIQTVFDDYIVCLVDGKCVRNIRAYVKNKHGFINFSDYLTKYNLPPDYPTMAKNASLLRSNLAKKNGLGVKKHGSA